jgi:hypothetical protein
MAYGGSSIDVTPSMARSSMPAFGHSIALIYGILGYRPKSYLDLGVSSNILFQKHGISGLIFSCVLLDEIAWL